MLLNYYLIEKINKSENLSNMFKYQKNENS